MITVVDESVSTNADLLAAILAGEPCDEGDWLVAQQQTNGRGRMGREWVSPPGNLYCSTAICLQRGDPSPASLSHVAGLALFDTLERSLLPNAGLLLKWPNDVLVRGAKIAGILLERAQDKVVIGFGVNVTSAPQLADRETTHVVYENGKHGGDPMLVGSILSDELAKRVAAWRNKGISHTFLEWAARSHRYGDRLSVALPEGSKVDGRYRGLDADGALKMRDFGGMDHTIHAGDVMLG